MDFRNIRTFNLVMLAKQTWISHKIRQQLQILTAKLEFNLQDPCTMNTAIECAAMNVQTKAPITSHI